MPLTTDLAEALKLPSGSANQLAHLGRLWHAYVWLEKDTTTATDARTRICEAVNGQLATAKIKITRGFQAYDPVVRRGRPKRYVALAATMSGGTDGGAGHATAIIEWIKGSRVLSALPEAAQEFVVITHFAELGRGYGSELDALYKRLVEIAQTGSAVKSKALWGDLATKWSPVLTYKEDSSTDWDPEKDGDTEMSKD
ncbi:hypothetical protein LG634_05440 [Streptomyces bambusae]|uniref:hypothetical protein n=1 Tax=Streptomyces bambusae TaxID=1550616 RepID=UPI001CFD8243|nr:hypothetical protein [Streptomyces bambusae]MCB5164282.1 hypothetical protein [Streptomyces bambusae]